MMCENSSAAACPYDVGDILTTTNARNPTARWPGTEWTQITGRFLLGAGDIYPAESTGGEEKHTLTFDEMPSHQHGIAYHDESQRQDESRDTMTTQGYTDRWRPVTSSILNNGNSEPHNNMPPYLAVYVWKRTK